MSRLRDLEPPAPVQRYERDTPGELIHIDIKKLGRFDRVGHRITGDRTRKSSGRGIGWEYLYLAIDDHSRLAYSEIHLDEQRASCLAFLFNALRFFRRHGIRVERVMADNGAGRSSKSRAGTAPGRPPPAPRRPPASATPTSGSWRSCPASWHIAAPPRRSDCPSSATRCRR